MNWLVGHAISLEYEEIGKEILFSYNLFKLLCIAPDCIGMEDVHIDMEIDEYNDITTKLDTLGNVVLVTRHIDESDFGIHQNKYFNPICNISLLDMCVDYVRRLGSRVRLLVENSVCISSLGKEAVESLYATLDQFELGFDTAGDTDTYVHNSSNAYVPQYVFVYNCTSLNDMYVRVKLYFLSIHLISNPHFVGLGWFITDLLVNNIARVLKMLYVSDLRQLQDDLNGLIVLGQEYTANP